METSKKQIIYGDFNGQLANGNINNHIHHDQGRPLTGKERVEINNKVKILHEKYGEHGGRTWTFLHKTIGVESVDAMCLGHRDAAHAIVDLLLERAELAHQLKQTASALHQLTEKHTSFSDQLKFAQQAKYKLEQRLLQQERALSEAQNSVAYLRSQRTPSHCTQCASATDILGQTRKNLAVLIAITVVAIAVSVFFGYQRYSLAGQLQFAQQQLVRCEYGGSLFTVGSIIDNKNATDLRCVSGKDGFAPQWQAISPKSPQTKSKALPKKQAKPKRQQRVEPEPIPEMNLEQTSPANGMEKLF